MNLLESVLSSTEARFAARPIVVSEQHNFGKIAVGEVGQDVRDQIDRLKSGRGGWDAAEYGISREAQIARLERALADLVNDPQAVEKELATMRERALRRASLATSRGKISVMVAGEAPWHKLGVNVAEAVSSADAIRLASMDWEATKVPLRYTNPITGTMDVAPGKFGVVRSDTGEMLGAVGSLYSPIQNRDGFAFLDAVLGQFGAKFETAGALYNGSKVWMQVRLPEQSFRLGEADQVDFYAIFTNVHDGSETAKCFPTSHRVVCNNTFRTASVDAARGISIRHVGDVRRRIADAQRALGLAVQGAQTFAEQAETLKAAKVDALPYFHNLLDEVLDVTQEQAMSGAELVARALGKMGDDFEAERKRIQKQIDKRRTILDDILERYDSERCGVDGMRGTGWAAFNAVTESADHGQLGGRQTGTSTEKASRRFESVLNGNADEVKQLAFEKVLELAS